MHKKQFVFMLLLLFLPLAPLARAIQKDHPRLVDVATTDCTSCHDDLIEGLEDVHPPVSDDCTICHDVTISEAGTQVALLDPDPQLCVMCHDELEAAVEGELEVPHMPVEDACTTCHDPHASRISRLLLSPMPELCMDCHDLSELAAPHGGQLTEKANCLSCHVPHGSPNQHMVSGSRLHPPFADGDCSACHRDPFAGRIRLRGRGERVCTACHGDILEPPADEDHPQSVHAALRAGRNQDGCISCHSPHMSSARSLLLKGGPELCARCHEGIVSAARAETGHAAAADDCTACHLPHRSAERRLLTDPTPDLCTFCHEPDDDELSTKHLGADLGELDCTTCHSPHGAGNPMLLAKTAHPPVLDDCGACHEDSFDQLYEDGESALCLECHYEIEELIESATVSHDALEVGICIDCHSPHASEQRKLVKLPSGGACFECHFEIEPEEGEHLHGVIDSIGCEACHEPHGGQNEKLLRRTGSELCMSCHIESNVEINEEAETVRILDKFELPLENVAAMATLRLSPDGQRNHPVASHRVLGTPTEDELGRIDTTFSGELTCLTCHDPHKSPSGGLLRPNETTGITSCATCHPK